MFFAELKNYVLGFLFRQKQKTLLVFKIISIWNNATLRFKNVFSARKKFYLSRFIKIIVSHEKTQRKRKIKNFYTKYYFLRRVFSSQQLQLLEFKKLLHKRKKKYHKSIFYKKRISFNSFGLYLPQIPVLRLVDCWRSGIEVYL